ncbi:MAG: hypothetical protein AAGF11_06315 [Myxococcota bacterium]
MKDVEVELHTRRTRVADELQQGLDEPLRLLEDVMERADRSLTNVGPLVENMDLEPAEELKHVFQLGRARCVSDWPARPSAVIRGQGRVVGILSGCRFEDGSHASWKQTIASLAEDLTPK